LVPWNRFLDSFKSLKIRTLNCFLRLHPTLQLIQSEWLKISLGLSLLRDTVLQILLTEDCWGRSKSLLRVIERGFISAVIIQKYEELRHFLASKVLMGYFYFFSLCLTSQKAPNFHIFLLRNRIISNFPVGLGREEGLRRIPNWD
jgi:hypothetical protein